MAEPVVCFVGAILDSFRRFLADMQWVVFMDREGREAKVERSELAFM